MNYDEQHRKHLMAYLQQVERLFYQLVGTAVFIALKTDYKELITSTLFAFAATKKGKAFDKELANFNTQLDQIIKKGITNEWAFANSKQDQLLRAGVTKYKNLEALEAFKVRKIKDFTISDRVWDIAKKAQTEIELALSVSLQEGKSAVQLSREVRNLLNNPTALFRRVRDQYGNLVLSKNAQNYHPGQGVYRSAYKNALRLTSNEINVAYKSADWLRIQQNPDIVGFEVRLSPQHKVYDMCDELKGKYPKTFHFHGWHVGCKCHIITLLKTDEELIKELKADETLPPESSSNYVAEVPNNYKQWVTDNKDRFKNWKTKPYFIEANRNDKDILQKLLEVSNPVPKSTYVSFEPFSPVIIEHLKKTGSNAKKQTLLQEIIDDNRAKTIFKHETNHSKTVLFDLHKGKGESLNNTIEMAKALNEKGKSVALLPEYENISSADAIVHFKNKLVIADFKHSTTKKIGTLKADIEKGFLQSDNVVLQLENGNTDLFVQSIEELKRKGKGLGNMILMNKHNDILEISEKEFKLGKYRKLVKGFF